VRGRIRLRWFGLGVVVATLGLGATVAGADRASRRRERRIEENEAAAVATLRLIAEAQERFKAMRAVDVDEDGIGEFGGLRELAGSIAVRSYYDGTNWDGVALATPLVPTELGRLNSLATARMDGYLFKVFLPGVYGEAVEEAAPSSIDTLAGWLDFDELAERYWCCYARPSRPGRSGRRTFFINQDGVVTSRDERDVSFWRRIDTGTAGAAFAATENGSSSITGTQALGTVGRDGNFWRVVE